MLLDDMRKELVQGLTDIFRNNVSMIILYGSVARAKEMLSAAECNLEIGQYRTSDRFGEMYFFVETVVEFS